MDQKKKVLVISDFVGLSTGFATVAKNLVYRWLDDYEIAHLACAYSGDYSDWQKILKLYTTDTDLYGYGKVARVISIEKPDLVFIINDPWVVARMASYIRAKHPDVPIVAYCPVDAENLNPEYVQLCNLCNHVILYTEFGLQQMTKSGLTVTTSIIPHGVDTTVFYPQDRKAAREALGLPEDVFIVLNLNANNPRKNLDFFFFAFKRWLDQYPHDNARVYYHGALQGDLNVVQYLNYLGIEDRLMITHPKISGAVGAPVDVVSQVYNAADVFMTACSNEGWSLSVHEAMACGIPVIAPDFSAVAEWANGAFYPLEINRDVIKTTPQNLSTIHYLPELQDCIEALELMYQSKETRERIGQLGYSRATENRFDWDVIAHQFKTVFRGYIDA